MQSFFCTHHCTVMCTHFQTQLVAHFTTIVPTYKPTNEAAFATALLSPFITAFYATHPKAIGKAVDALNASEGELRRNRVDLVLAVRGILTEAQWKECQQMRRQTRSERREERREGREERREGREGREGRGER